MDSNLEDKKKQAYRVGVVVIFMLAVFTIGEFFIGAIAIGWIAPLLLIALIKAALIIQDYMHLPRLFRREE
jgi:hypothetical protein